MILLARARDVDGLGLGSCWADGVLCAAVGSATGQRSETHDVSTASKRRIENLQTEGSSGFCYQMALKPTLVALVVSLTAALLIYRACAASRHLDVDPNARREIEKAKWR